MILLLFFNCRVTVGHQREGGIKVVDIRALDLLPFPIGIYPGYLAEGDMGNA